MAGVADAIPAGEDGLVMLSQNNIASMRILALDTSSREGGLAMWCDGETWTLAGAATGGSHAERLPGEIIDWLRARSLSLRDVDVFAIVSGPGSFTGLRVGVACVQGLALAGGREVIAVPTLEAMAAAAIEAGIASVEAILVPCLDGQRGDLFFSAYRARPGARRLVDADEIIAPRVDRPDGMLAALATARGSTVVVAAGGGAWRERSVIDAAGVRIAPPLPPLAGAVARLAATRLSSAMAPHGVRPMYIRRPDAELARVRAGGPA
jgi:tRNA threonylcarbamoyladenosine biosynthesis protein TsaB